MCQAHLTTQNIYHHHVVVIMINSSPMMRSTQLDGYDINSGDDGGSQCLSMTLVNVRSGVDIMVIVGEGHLSITVASNIAVRWKAELVVVSANISSHC